MTDISIIIPCYYNEENIPSTVQRLLDNEASLPPGTTVEYVMVDDGSRDRTFDLLMEFKKNIGERVRVIKLSGNFGSYTAILAGMKYATGKCTVVISADLQDPPELIPKMYAYWQQGFKLVLANRENREDAFFDGLFARWYHRIVKRYALPSMPEGGFDFCLFDARLRDEVVAIDEKNTNTLFLLVWLKYDFVSIPYTRRKRAAGKSRWTFRKKLKLLIDSFVGFSFMPVRIISVAGIALGFIALLYALVIFIGRVTGNIHVEGWSALMIAFLFISAFQMVALGILGEYLWRILDTARKRPSYVVEREVL